MTHLVHPQFRHQHRFFPYEPRRSDCRCPHDIRGESICSSGVDWAHGLNIGIEVCCHVISRCFESSLWGRPSSTLSFSLHDGQLPLPVHGQYCDSFVEILEVGSIRCTILHPQLALESDEPQGEIGQRRELGSVQTRFILLGHFEHPTSPMVHFQITLRIEREGFAAPEPEYPGILESGSCYYLLPELPAQFTRHGVVRSW